MINLLLGNCLEQMKTLPENSVDAVVTDPPYGLSFMGKSWDYDVPTEEIWREALRVLKPGGHLLSFFGTRTYHRGVVRIEDAGFEIRDQIMWLYGSGFPKSHNIKEGDFKGWGTALKPANEPIVVARKPLEKGLTVAENVLKYGTGALNIDASRIGYSTDEKIDFNKVQDGNIYGANGVYGKAEQKQTTPLFKENGRWPANILFDEEAAALLGENSRFFYIAKASKSERNAGLEDIELKQKYSIDISKSNSHDCFTKGDKNPCIPQANNHPTVKPIKLMQYLIKLVTPPSGTVLDPFMGSGSTGVAANKLGFSFIGCEMSSEYFEIAKKRIETNV